MEKILHKMKENRIAVDIILIFIISLILSIPNLNQNADIYFDDGCQHLMRSYGAYKTLLFGGKLNVISSFANGFGYSWDLFYGPLSEYCMLILSVALGSFNNGFKLLMCIILFVSRKLNV